MTRGIMSLALAGAAVAAGVSFAPQGQAAPAAVQRAPAQSQLVQRVDADAYYWRHHRRYARGTHVRAPGTAVDVEGGTQVEAPFTMVHTDRHGTWVRAPFVDLFIPR